MAELALSDLKVGSTYRAKKPRKGWGGEYDDRTILWIGGGWDSKTYRYTKMVQYDSITVSLGRHYPTVSAEQFLKWAKFGVEDQPEDKEETK